MTNVIIRQIFISKLGVFDIVTQHKDGLMFAMYLRTFEDERTGNVRKCAKSNIVVIFCV